MAGYHYVGMPYSAESKATEQRRVNLARLYVSRLMKDHRIHALCTVIHSHEMALENDMPTDIAYWREFNMSILRRSDGLIILPLDRWENSTGLAEEIEIARGSGLPILRYDYLLNELFPHKK